MRNAIYSVHHTICRSGVLLGVGRELATKLFYKHVVHFVGFECEVNDVLTYGVFVLLGDVGEVNAVHQEYLAPLDTHFVGREVGAEHVVEHFLDIFLGKQVYRSHHEKVGAVAYEDAYFGTPLVEQPCFISVAGENRVDSHLLDCAFAKLGEWGYVAFVEDAFGQFLAARGAIGIRL